MRFPRGLIGPSRFGHVGGGLALWQGSLDDERVFHTMRMMADVFISYASADKKLAETLASELESDGIAVWWSGKLGIAEKWDREIEDRIAQASIVVVLWTVASVESEWVRNEAEYAREHDKLLQVTLGFARPPLAFRSRQSVEAFENHFGELLLPIRTLLEERRQEGVIDWPGLGPRASAAEKQAFCESLAAHIETVHRDGRPIFVDTASPELLEMTSVSLKRRSVPHQALHQNHFGAERAGLTLAVAGEPGAVTLAVSGAHLTRQIKLGGDVDHRLRTMISGNETIGQIEAKVRRAHEEVAEWRARIQDAGGLELIRVIRP